MFKFGQDNYIGTLLDLPCITESFKTYDNTNYYKSADVGQVIIHSSILFHYFNIHMELVRFLIDIYQMFVLHDPSEEDPELNCDSAHKLFDGITPPTRNIRKRKFRKVEDKRVRLLLVFSSLSHTLL